MGNKCGVSTSEPQLAKFLHSMLGLFSIAAILPLYCINMYNKITRFTMYPYMHAGFLNNADVYGETVLRIVGGERQKLKWLGYGFKIDVPKGALPPGVTAIMEVRVIVVTKFKLLSENTQLTSAIYWITCSEEFLEEVTVKIQHSAVIKSEEECSRCRFVIARCSQDQLIFKEKVGIFKPTANSKYAAIKLKKFSSAATTSPGDTKLKCGALHFYTPIPGTSRVDSRHVVVCNHEPHLTVKRKMCL